MLEVFLGWMIGVGFGVIVHEAGHAAMALATGLRLRAITIGSGRTLFARDYRDIAVKINAVPFVGRVGIFSEVYQRKSALLTFILGGITANLILASGVLFLGSFGLVPRSFHGAAIGFFLAQIYLIAWSVIPRTFTINGEPTVRRQASYLDSAAPE